ncbi:hypothetical protein HYX08_00925 [Candidatus Woesearchaeota archaeon]|nr:hypothetical protein [Candidatus Woesearchaeota archaeon]
MGILGFTGERLKHAISYTPTFIKLSQFKNARAYTWEYKAEHSLEAEEEHIIKHLVTIGLLDQTRYARQERIAEQDAIKEGMDQLFFYHHVLKTTHHFADALEKFIVEANKRDPNDNFRKRVDEMSRRILKKIFQDVKIAESEEDSDMRFAMSELNEALSKGSGRITDNIRTAFKKKGVHSRIESLLMKRAMRKGVRIEHANWRMLEKHSNEMEGITKEIGPGAKPETFTRALNRFERILAESEQELVQIFVTSHQVIRRVLILMAIILSKEELFQGETAEWIAKHYTPEVQTQKVRVKIKKLADTLAEKLRLIENGLNTHLKELNSLERQFRREEAEA